MADNGSSMYISGAPDDSWDNNDLHNLGTVTASDFEVVQMNPDLHRRECSAGRERPSSPASPQVRNPSPPGTSITLSWNVTGASYLIVSPGAGAGARHERDDLADPVHHVHAVRHQRLRPKHRDAERHRALGRSESRSYFRG